MAAQTADLPAVMQIVRGGSKRLILTPSTNRLPDEAVHLDGFGLSGSESCSSALAPLCSST